MGTTGNAISREPWNKGKIVGQKAPFKVKDIWALRVRLQMDTRPLPPGRRALITYDLRSVEPGSRMP
jgi:hypothetical protein